MLVPQPLVAVTLSVPEVAEAEKLILTELVVPVIVVPFPEYLQVYVTPVTLGTVYTTLDVPSLTTEADAVNAPGCAASGFTVINALTLLEQPLPLVTVYEIVVVPAETPVTTPVFEMVATAGAELLQTPAAVASVRAVVFPTQTLFVPPIAAGAAGSALTVKTLVAEFPQPVVMVYFTVTVPAVTPVTTPPVVMLAVPVPAIIDQVPPAVASVKAGVAEFAQTAAAPPAMAATVGRGLIVNALVADAEHPPLVTV